VFYRLFGLQQHVLHAAALGLHKLSWDLANELKTKYKWFVCKYKVFKSQSCSQGLTELYIVNLLASYAYNSHNNLYCISETLQHESDIYN